MPFTLPPLPYAFDALEPYIDAKTMEIHHDKHHAAYVTNLNKALEPYPNLQSKTLEELLGSLDSLPEAIRAPVRNNGGGHWNHSYFWPFLKKNNGAEPTGDLLGRPTTFEAAEDQAAEFVVEVQPCVGPATGSSSAAGAAAYDDDIVSTVRHATTARRCSA